MNSLHIRNVSPETIRGLKALAERHHRSLQGELRTILEEASRMARAEGSAGALALHVVRSGNADPVGRDQIYGEHGR